ncbi:MAG: methyltransferase domain-containing protein [Treponema sp.]|jgi:ubiquinone/menaquinone biosynthesis C-methylase UbiE|nr:methyltransferase domain-containing protein [Treponema sp.]
MVDNIYKSTGKIINGINTFIDINSLSGENKKFSELYNKIAPFYNISQKIFYKIKFGGENNFRNDFLKYIIVNDNNLVLETSVGTADNFYYMNKKAKYYGVDISIKMLKMAKKHSEKWNVNSELVCCEAENLPLNDNVFDVVYSCGGFNSYNDKKKALLEMIRVAKTGSKIFIIDETGKTIKNIYKNVPGKELYNIEKANMPLNLIPKEMENIKGEIICKGYMYIISFNKV